MRQIAVIVNPRSAGGRTARRWGRLRAALEDRLGAVEVRLTETPGHAIELARELVRGGFTLIVGVGGDGTYNEIANGLLLDDQPLNSEAKLGILPLGTGGDFQRTLGIPSRPEQAVELLARGRTIEIDVGKLVCRTPDGGAARRYFVNLVSFGMGGEVAARSRNFLSPLGGKTAFFYATVQVFPFYRSKTVELALDDGRPRGYRVLNVAIGNGRYHGGGMHVCPRAALDDGLLEVTVIEDLSLFTLLKDLSYLYDGRIYAHPKVRHFHATRLQASSPEITRIEVDGEPLGTLPIEITILPKRLKVLVPEAIVE